MLTATKPPKCKHCKVRMPPDDLRALHDDCVEPWLKANYSKLQRRKSAKCRADAKVERAGDRKKREENKTLPKLIAEAQTAFNAWIRWRDRGTTCFVCDRPFIAGAPGRVMHAGHVRSRGAAGHLRFNEDNCHGECEGCNGPRGAKPHEIKAGAIARIGLAAFEALENDNAPHKWTKDEVRGIREEYRARLRREMKETT